MSSTAPQGLRNEHVTVGTTATKLVTHGDETESVVVLVPSGGSTVYVGGPGVTTGSGVAITAGQSFSIDMNDRSGALHGVVASGSQDVHVLTVG